MRGPAASPGPAMRRSLWEEVSIRYRLRAQMRSSECCCSFLVNREKILGQAKAATAGEAGDTRPGL
jgi:hypothetical protein